MTSILRSSDVGRALRERQRGFLLNPFLFASGDRYRANVSLLCPFDGSIADVIGNTLTSHNSPTLVSSSGGPFAGTGYVQFNGTTSQYLSLPTSSAFDVGSGDWTIDWWAYLLASPQQYGVVFATREGDVAAGIAVKMNNASTSSMGLEMYNVAGASMGGTYPAIDSISVGAWVYMGVERIGGTWYVARGGVGSRSGSITGAHYYNSANSIVIGGQSSPSRTTNLRMAYLRFTKGVGRDLTKIPTGPESYA